MLKDTDVFTNIKVGYICSAASSLVLLNRLCNVSDVQRNVHDCVTEPDTVPIRQALNLNSVVINYII